MDPKILREITQSCIETGRINFNGQFIDTVGLELILTVLRIRGDLKIENAGGVMSLVELGASLSKLP